MQISEWAGPVISAIGEWVRTVMQFPKELALLVWYSRSYGLTIFGNCTHSLDSFSDFRLASRGKFANAPAWWRDRASYNHRSDNMGAIDKKDLPTRFTARPLYLLPSRVRHSPVNECTPGQDPLLWPSLWSCSSAKFLAIGRMIYFILNSCWG